MLKTIIAALFAVLFMTGCEAASEPELFPAPTPAAVEEPEAEPIESTPTPTKTPKPKPAPEPTVEENIDTIFLTVLRSKYPQDFVAVPDTMLVELGNMICDGFDAGLSFEEVALVGLSSGYSPKSSGFLIGASISSYCPQFENLLP
jgi:hypothetical protein